MKHELVQLAGKIDWDWLDREIAPLYSDKGRPGIETRFVFGLSRIARPRRADRCDSARAGNCDLSRCGDLWCDFATADGNCPAASQDGDRWQPAIASNSQHMSWQARFNLVR
jgi:hypothetical protein